ncbi:MAG: TspO/MBR family protein [Candidatus Babeliales bacterium]
MLQKVEFGFYVNRQIERMCYVNFKPNYFIIPSIAILVSTLGRHFTAQGMTWYQTLQVPWFVPPAWFFGIVWTIIFSLTTAAAVIVWNGFSFARSHSKIMAVFFVNALLNVLWTYIFFVQQNIGLALVDALALEISVLLLIAFIWPLSRSVAYLLVPYAVWVAFACYLNYIIWMMNYTLNLT